ncbi:MAG: dienelactone hydrolase family protein [Pseudolabrys sp.]|nr:dienelactone hydrolase family protein [Pseudolabrys sp.]
MSEWIDLTASDGHRVSAYVARPTAKPAGAVVIAQEVFGVNSHIQDVVNGYARDGFLAIAPSFFDRIERGIALGYERPDVERGLALTKQLDVAQTVMDAQAAIDHARKTGPTGMVGYCWGGTTSWTCAAQANGLAAAVCYYGGGIIANGALTPRCPVMIYWAELDTIIPIDKARDFIASHPKIEHHTYPADHGFNCNLRGSYHEPSAALAKTRTLAFLRKHLG